MPMKIWITNDDSISASGIAVLAEVAMEFGDVYVVAPARQCSAMSQRMTLREPLTVEKVADFPVPVWEAYQVDGTPVDCVKVALSYLWKEKPDVLLSGINHGYNIGSDIAYSGTLGAAFEAVRNGIPAIALSAASKAEPAELRNWLRPILRELLTQPMDTETVVNVNFPKHEGDVPKGIRRNCPVAPVGMFREKYTEIRLSDGRVELHNVGISTPGDSIPAGTDGDAVRRGYIAISTLKSQY